MSKCKILIVEDEPVVGKNIAMFLRLKGYDVIGITENSEEAVKIATREMPQLIIMDIEIEGNFDGIETAKRINEIASVPVLYLTAYSDERTIRRAKQTDPCGYIVKPVNPKELTATIELAINKNRIETKLKRSEEKYSDLYNNAPDMYISIDAKTGEIIECNDRVVKTTGYGKSELIGRKVFEIYHPDSRKRANTVFREFQKTGEVKGEDLKILKKDGSVGYVSLSASAVRDKKGRIVKSRSLWRDITEKKKMEKKVSEMEERYRSTLNALPDVVYLVDRDLKILLGNDRCRQAVELAGYTGEYIGEDLFHVFDFLTDDIKDEYLEVFKTGRELDTIRSFDIRGREVHTSTRKVPIIEKGKVEMILTVITDITEKKLVEQQLRENEERFRLLFENSPLPYQALDMYGKVIEVNNSWLDVMGYKKEEVVGRVITDFFDTSSLETFHETLPGFQSTGEARNIEILMKKKNSENILVSITAKQSPGRDQSSVRVHCIFSDITEQREAERRLEASLNEKDILLKEVHHRVKNNMQVIISLINLQALYVEDSNILDFFKDTMNRIRSMALVHEKLYQSDDISAINFGEYIRELTTDITHQYLSGGLKGNVNLDLDDIVIGVDRAIPCGIIINELVSNSFKHGLKEKDHGEINIRFHKSGDRDAVLQISDNGIGLPESFDISSINSLGLKLVDSLVLQINGNLVIDKQDSASFSITFPLQD